MQTGSLEQIQLRRTLLTSCLGTHVDHLYIAKQVLGRTERQAMVDTLFFSFLLYIVLSCLSYFLVTDFLFALFIDICTLIFVM